MTAKDLETPETDADAAREAAERILSAPEFRQSRGLFDRIVDWISDIFDRLVPEGVGGGSGASSFVIVLIVVAAIALAVVAARAWGRYRRERSAEGPSRPGVTVVLGERVDPADLRSAAVEAEASRDWRRATIARYRLLVLAMVDRGWLGDAESRTTGEYRGDVRHRAPELASSFDAATAGFERVYYGAGAVSEAEFQVFTRRVDDVLTPVGAR